MDRRKQADRGQPGIRRILGESTAVFLLSVVFSLSPASLISAEPVLGAASSQSAQVRGWQGFQRSDLLFHPAAPEVGGGVRFVSSGKGYDIGIASDRVWLALRTNRSPVSMAKSESTPRSVLLTVEFKGGNREARMEGASRARGRAHRFLGADSAKWRTNMPLYRRILSKQVYPGIDAEFYGNQRRLEFDFRVSPGSDPDAIAMSFRGAERIRITDLGDLELRVKGQSLEQRRPVAYQLNQRGTVLVECSYRMLDDGTVGFQVGEYDESRELVIDPILSYSSFLGGGANDAIRRAAFDDEGMLYVTGSTFSADFLTLDPFQEDLAGSSDVFITKINPADYSVVFSTFIGGAREDVSDAIALDGSRNVYVAGRTDSGDFPTANAAQELRRGFDDAFVTKLNADGSALVFSTYLGGSNNDSARDLLIRQNGDGFVVGVTSSRNFPETDRRAFVEDIFVSEFTRTGTLLDTTLIGGAGIDRPFAAIFENERTILIAGQTRSTDFPMPAPIPPVDPMGAPTPVPTLQAQLNGQRDAFVLRYDVQEGAITYSTYLGGSGNETARGVAVGSFGDIFVFGETTSSDFPVINPIQAENAGGQDLFVARLNPIGSALILGTYLGGAEDDFITAGTIDSANSVLLAGHTTSADFPVEDALQPVKAAGVDGIVAKIEPFLSQILFSTFLGGADDDRILTLVLDPQGRTLVAGETASADFPLTEGAIQSDLGGQSDGFLALLSEVSTLSFPLIGDGGQAPGALSSRIVLVNKSPVRTASVRVLLRGATGAPLSLDLNGAPSGGEVEVAVPPGGNQSLATDGIGTAIIGSVQAVSDLPISGFIEVDAGVTGTVGISPSQSFSSLILPIRATRSGVTTGLAVMGLGGGQTLEMVLRDSSGVVRGQASVPLAPRGHSLLFVNQIDFTPNVDFSDFEGNLTVVGTQDFAATAILLEPGRLISLPLQSLREE